ncbi:inovirus Gp2 family protein [Pseudacidovorax sp. RU35E]|uniref:inovirus Gp2 family protein n=1 Tax=Pseudacidovorax sp. RU35E TaxID=1907403 RepID=UPI001179A391|nr:inovirus Gp2 family protein [Pseudacidovorax sp. RU35E]
MTEKSELFIEGHLDDLMEAPEYHAVSFHENPAGLVLTPQSNASKRVKRIAESVKNIAQGDGTLFSCFADRSGRLHTQATAEGQRLLTDIAFHLPELENFFPSHSFNPYISALLIAVHEQEVLTGLLLDWPDQFRPRDNRRYEFGSLTKTVCDSLNALVTAVRLKCRSKPFLRALDHLRRRCQKNYAGAVELIDSLLLPKKRLLALRGDFTCGQESADVRGVVNSMTASEAKILHARLIRHVREHYGLRGYISKFEYGLLTGYHFHILFLLDGREHWRDVPILQQVGKHWTDGLTEGRGRFRNCNAQSYARRGVGMIKWDDQVTRLVLVKKVLPYLCKTDFWMFPDGVGRTFMRSVIAGEKRSAGI